MSGKKKHGHSNRSKDSDYDNDDNHSEYDNEVVNARGGNYRTENDFLQARCEELENAVKSLQLEIRVLKSHDRLTKCQMRIPLKNKILIWQN